MSLPLKFWPKIWAWIKKKWEWVAGLFIGLLTLLSVLIRSRQQKKVLEAANKAHEKENRINEKAKDDLVDGLTKITKEKENQHKEIIEDSRLGKEKLEKEKKEFIDDAASSDDLARKIADHLDAELVDANNE